MNKRNRAISASLLLASLSLCPMAIAQDAQAPAAASGQEQTLTPCTRADERQTLYLSTTCEKGVLVGRPLPGVVTSLNQVLAAVAQSVGENLIFGDRDRRGD